jgi:hypothetical protein
MMSTLPYSNSQSGYVTETEHERYIAETTSSYERRRWCCDLGVVPNTAALRQERLI